MSELTSYLPWITASGVIVAIYMNVKGMRRNNTQDISCNAEKLAKISSTLESVRDGVDDIRVEMRTQQKQINDLTERVVRVEESDKAAHRRIDTVERERSHENNEH